MRGFKPEIWTDEKFVELSPLARLLFMGMWNWACDSGHVDNKPKQLKMRILPTDDVDVSELMAEIGDQGLTRDQGDHLLIPNLPRHQRLDKRYLTTCDHCESDGHTQGARSEHDGDTSGARWAHAQKEGRKEVERKGEEGSATGARRGKRAITLPSKWQPNEGHREYADNNRLNLSSEADQFRDHHRAKGSTMKDWDAAFRTWLRNSVKWRKEAPPAPPRMLQTADQIERPPDGLSPEEYAAWERERRERRRA